MPEDSPDPSALPKPAGTVPGKTGSADPYRRLPPPGQCRIKINPAQQAFHWAGNSVPAESPKKDTPTPVIQKSSDVPAADPDATSRAPTSPSPAASTPTSRALGTNSPALLKGKRPFKEVVERYLREMGVPYIAVDEAKRALFAGAKLRSFHFVVYRTPQKNWLLHTAQLRKEVRENLREWEAIFGDGFMAVVVKQKSDGTLKFQTLKGDAVEIK